jgi:hypothetical protein
VRTGDEKKARYREKTLHTPTNSYRRRYWVHWSSGVVKARIEEMYPDMPIYEVYNVVTSVCEDPDIITHTLEDVIRTTCETYTNSIFNTFVMPNDDDQDTPVPTPFVTQRIQTPELVPE